ncbi:MAG: argininosuccinate lyase, partial [Actinobacteria bacterium]|nr:argininosuccinate lyase [Actinomycetota bacterium]
MSSTLWHGRFAGGPSEALQALNDSLPFDQRMFREDIAGSRAHVRMLCDVGLFTEAERDGVLAALDTVEHEIESGSFDFQVNDEDIHTAVERRVTELDPAGAKMHTGRSRNDQVATDLRLWTRSAIDEVLDLVERLQRTLLTHAEQAGDAYLPGYTHLQQAQPVALSHHLLAHGWALARDAERLVDARKRTNVSVLGAGALAGSSLPLDPEKSAAYLGFDAVFDNSLGGVADRDFVAEVLFALSLLGVHLSRIGEEWILWASTEFGFVTLDDGFSTGSSMMPQKKNPDIAELARGKAGRLIGHLTGFLTTLKGLPLTYNKDMQEDKEPLFDAVDTVRLTLLALDGMIRERRESISDELIARVVRELSIVSLIDKVAKPARSVRALSVEGGTVVSGPLLQRSEGETGSMRERSHGREEKREEKRERALATPHKIQAPEALPTRLPELIRSG